MRRFAVLPLGCYAVIAAYACYGALVVGHWPYYAHPDPQELPHRMLSRVVVAVMFVGVVSLLLVPIGYALWRLVIRLKERPITNHRGAVQLYFAGAFVWLIGFVALNRNAPWHSIVNWLLD